MAHGIIVLGVARGGTTMTAEIVQRWGAYSGEDSGSLAQGDPWSPRGYWEYPPLRSFNKELLRSMNMSEALPPDPRDTHLLQERVADPHYRDRAHLLLAGMQHPNQVWFWKDPLMCFLLPFWQQIWNDRDIIYVVVVRNPIDTAISQQKMTTGRNNRPVSLDKTLYIASFLYWQITMVSLLERINKNTIFIKYEDIISKPHDNCVNLCRFLNNTTETDKPIETTANSMASIITPELHRNASSIPFSLTTEDNPAQYATPSQVALYSFLQEKVQNHELTFNPDSFPLPDNWKSYLASLT